MKRRNAIRNLKLGQKFRFKQPWGSFSGVLEVTYVGKIIIKFKNKYGQEHNFVKSLFDLTRIKRP